MGVGLCEIASKSGYRKSLHTRDRESVYKKLDIRSRTFDSLHNWLFSHVVRLNRPTKQTWLLRQNHTLTLLTQPVLSTYYSLFLRNINEQCRYCSSWPAKSNAPKRINRNNSLHAWRHCLISDIPCLWHGEILATIPRPICRRLRCTQQNHPTTFHTSERKQ